MKQKQQAQPEFTTDADGQRLAHVALANTDQRATLYAEDFERLMDAGFSPLWCAVNNGTGLAYPVLNAYTAQGHNRVVSIARLLAAPGAGKRVRCADGNNLNLRAENLRLEAAPVRRSAAEWYPSAAALRAAGIEPAFRVRDQKTTPEGKARSVLPRPAKALRESLAPAAAPEVPMATRAPHTPRVVDVTSLGQRVREQMAAQALEVTA